MKTLKKIIRNIKNIIVYILFMLLMFLPFILLAIFMESLSPWLTILLLILAFAWILICITYIVVLGIGAARQFERMGEEIDEMGKE